MAALGATAELAGNSASPPLLVQHTGCLGAQCGGLSPEPQAAWLSLCLLGGLTLQLACSSPRPLPSLGFLTLVSESISLL